jgi:putative PEP-CTERM system TPR-repeat lipoprotein
MRMKYRHLRLVAHLTVAVALLAPLAACTKDDAGKYVASAKSYIAKRDYQAAVIEIKNALQREPDNGEARLLLATALMETGDPAGAESEVRKAIVAGAPENATYPLLARTLLAQGEFKKLTTELVDRKLSTPAARVQMGISLAIAVAAQGDTKRAKNLVSAALAEDPANARGLLLQAQFAAQEGDMAQAGKLVDAVLQNAPDDVEALIVKAQIEATAGRRDEAVKLYERAVAADPRSLAPRFALVSLTVLTGKHDIAKAQVAKMKELQPNDFRTLYSDALVSYVTGNPAHAHEVVERLVAARPDHLPSVFLSGLIDFQLGSNASAEASLRKVLARSPEDPNAGRILALVYLRQGRPADALEVLKPVLLRTPDDPVLLRTAGEAYLASGNTRLAAASYERANALDKGDVSSKVRLAQVRLAAGETERAFGDLQSLANADPSQTQADLAIVTEHIRRREYDKALAAVDALEKKQPKAALPSVLRGSVYLAKRDLANARKSYERALELEPEFYSAAFSLALLDIREGRPQAARERFDRILTKNPKNEQVLLASTELLRLMGGSPADVKASLEKAVAANPTSVRSRLALINDDLLRRDANAAMTSARAALAAVPNDPQLLDALGRSQIAAGDVNQGIDTFKRIVLQQPQNPNAYIRLADAQVAAKDFPAAIDSQRKALALQPEALPIAAKLAKIYMLAGRPGEALAEARKLQKSQPDKAAGFALEGEVLGAQAKWNEAATAFQTALSKQPLPAVAVGTYVSLQRAGKAAEATAMANKWMKDYSKDPTMPLMLAQQSQLRGNPADAKAGYRKVLELDPDNATALNNLAWMLTEEGDAKGLEYAEQAHRLAPFSPGVLDTLGVAVTKSGDPKRGVTLLRMASTLGPAQPDIRLHLAKALVASGDKVAARKELDELGKLDSASPIRVEADKLKSSL